MPERASMLEREIRSQAAVLAARTAEGWDDARRAAVLIRHTDYLVLAARGSSDNAARYAQYLLGSVARLPVALAAPWLYASGRPPRHARAAVMGISQSGASPDIVRVLAAGRDQGRPTIAITNDPESALAASADVVVALRAGPEKSVAASKTYLAELHAVAQIAACLAGSDRAWAASFDRLPAQVSELVGRELEERQKFDLLTRATLLTALGRGLSLPTAFETALKIRELSGIPAEAFSPPDLLHGPIAAIGPSGAGWVVAVGELEPTDHEAIERLRRAVGATVAVSDDSALLGRVDVAVPIPRELPRWVAPLLSILPAQAAALRLAELKGFDVDRPSGLEKVTMTR